MTKNAPFSPELQKKIDVLKARRTPIQMGSLSFDSPLLLAPMSSICTAPFRLLMEDLGAGGTVSELISIHGINYKNVRTVDMLKVDPREKNMGLQLFGEGAEAFAEAAKVAEEFNPKFIDINMGCPVKKVVGTGAGSSLLKDPSALPPLFSAVKKAIKVPLTIKIRLGWDHDSINALEVIHIAKEEGIEFVAVHGRTRAQQYTGNANWDHLEFLGEKAPLDIIGNGDLHTATLVKNRMKTTKCQALMLGRGPLRNPFLFLEPYMTEADDIFFTPQDHLEVINKLIEYSVPYAHSDHTLLVSIRKHLIWMAAGYNNVSYFRDVIFKTPDLKDTMKISEDFFLSLKDQRKRLQDHDSFMTSGHG
ncbi:tRNA dihydrouridine synthase DusB [Bacteriovorax stolpii]|uniref:tRNA-dihydrouridine synthase n=1 Tax=Bacteriovorax stolpii TaxID=960 RepID=A0A2K9NV30_BACTC|nr:tRNA-dihydrouridine synthase [Bacteriovorax stolpii]AUN98624.1 tRNA dihydrouridine synthase DusB [Bacteriovorax stolpii]QDK41396.1 tRNA dihydrouridine synthase DusB [Bacteriovorax stolpii]TDP55869.1 tRNA-U20-dihydrouridine synthase [Bacteriovorax stolpii]